MTILVLGGLYFGLRFAFGLFTPFNFWTAGQDIKNGKVQIVEIGEMPLNFEQKQNLATTYGFGFYLFGCNVTTDILNGTEYYNKKMFDHLESKYGVGLWTKFQSQLDSIIKADSIAIIENKVINVVLGQPLVQTRIHEVDSVSHGMRYLSFLAEPSPMTSNNFYVVKVMEDNGVNLVTHFNFWLTLTL